MRVAIACVVLMSVASCGQSDRATQTGDRTRVNVGSHHLELLVEGTDRGQPTVILESGLGGGIDQWKTVREPLGQATRVVSYSRAGMGGSQPGPRPRSAKRIVEELRAALQVLAIDPPYVLVGHSLGGLYVRAYAGMYPDEVHAIVLVDPTMEFREALTSSQVKDRLQQHWGSYYGHVQRLLSRVHPKMAVMAARSLLELEPYLEQVPISKREATRNAWLKLFTDRAQQIEGILGLMPEAERLELFASMESMRIVRESPATGIPVTLLIAGKKTGPDKTDTTTSDPHRSADYIAWSNDVRLQRFTEYIQTIPNGTMKTLDDAGHNIPQDRPDAIVHAARRLLSQGRGQ